MANLITGKIGIIYPTQTIQSKNGGNPLVKREFVIRALRFNPDDGTPELSERNTPILEINGEDRVGILDNFQKGDIVKVNIIVEGRSVKNQDGTFKFFNTVRATRIEKLNIKLDEPAPAPAPAVAPANNAQGAQGTQGAAPAANNDAQGQAGDGYGAGESALPF